MELGEADEPVSKSGAAVHPKQHTKAAKISNKMRGRPESFICHL
jgi:hypothetical protein